MPACTQTRSNPLESLLSHIHAVEATRMAVNTAADMGAAALEVPTNLGEAAVKTVATGTAGD